MACLARQESECVLRREHQAKQQGNPTMSASHTAQQNKFKCTPWSRALALHVVLDPKTAQSWTRLEPLPARGGASGPSSLDFLIILCAFPLLLSFAPSAVFLLSSSFHLQVHSHQVFRFLGLIQFIRFPSFCLCITLNCLVILSSLVLSCVAGLLYLY